MFTGIVQETGSIVSAQAGRLVVAAKETLRGIEPGGSISVNGVCLTVTSFDSKSFSTDIMPETRQRTNLGLLRAGDKVNLERPMVLGGELGGHLVQGHVDGTGKINSITRDGESILMRFETSPEILRYTAPKGFIAVDGLSLTIVDKDTGSFRVSLVDYTLKHTTLGSKQVGDMVNLEVDIIAKYVEQFIQPQHTGISIDFLQEHGFPVS